MTLPTRVIVTGASKGIGLAVSRRLLSQGVKVVGIARGFDDELAAEFCRVIKCDLSRLSSLEDFARVLASEEGDADALVFCAGAGRFEPIESMSVADIRHMIDLNLVAPIVLARAFVPGFKRRQRGDMVFIGSESAHLAGPRGTAYCASKFGLRGFARALRIECASRGVRISLVNPGMADTSFYEELDFGPGTAPDQHLRADDVAAVVEMILAAERGAVFDEINLTPTKKVIDFKRRDPR
jgi:NAD(P)-dependent dehydrogenase (short-subunit alcohol dehydrogenase family)